MLGVGLVPLLYLCGRELVSRRAGVVAAALAAVNPFMIWYSQEAREYMLLMVLCSGIAAVLRPRLAHPVRPGPDVVGHFVGAGGADAVLRRLPGRGRGTASALPDPFPGHVIACAAQVVVLAPLIPHVIPRLQSKALFITSQSLGVRLQQVPVTFGLNTLYQSSVVSYGLLGAAVLAAAVIALLVIGADDAELRGAGLAAALAGFVLLLPLGLALAGHDDYIARGLMPAWPPLAIVIAAACTARTARAAGAVLAVVLLAAFVWAGVKIDIDAAYQRARLARRGRGAGGEHPDPGDRRLPTTSSPPGHCRSTCPGSRGRGRASRPGPTPGR